MLRKISRISLLVIVGLSFATPAQAEFADGLVAYWPFEGNFEDSLGVYHGESSETVEDAEPIPFTAGKFGQSVQLNGENQSIYINGGSGGNDVEIEDPGGVTDTIENRFDFAFVEGEENTGSVAISTWFTVDAFDTNWQALIAKGEGSGWRMHRRGGDVPAELVFTGGTGGDGPRYNGDGSVINIEPDGAVWHHVVAMTDGSLIHNGEEGECDIELVNAGEAECLHSKQVWVNGQLVSTLANTQLENRANLMQIGDNPDSPNREWEGKVDDVAVWERALTVGEIQALYNEGDGNSLSGLLNPGLVGDFNGDEKVDFADFTILSANFNTEVDGAEQGDIDFNKKVNLTDFLKFREAFAAFNGGAGESASSVPEPTTFALLGMGTACWALSRRRRRR